MASPSADSDAKGGKRKRSDIDQDDDPGGTSKRRLESNAGERQRDFLEGKRTVTKKDGNPSDMAADQGKPKDSGDDQQTSQNQETNNDAEVEFHRQLAGAILEIGTKHASPSVIVDNMKLHPPTVTKERLKSHLQKFRQSRPKECKAFFEEYDDYLHKIQMAEQDKLSPESIKDIFDTSKLTGGEVAAYLCYNTMNEGKSSAGKGRKAAKESSILSKSFPCSVGNDGQMTAKVPYPGLTAAEAGTPLGKSLIGISSMLGNIKDHIMSQRRTNVEMINAGKKQSSVVNSKSIDPERSLSTIEKVPTPPAPIIQPPNNLDLPTAPSGSLPSAKDQANSTEIDKEQPAASGTHRKTDTRMKSSSRKAANLRTSQFQTPLDAIPLPLRQQPHQNRSFASSRSSFVPQQRNIPSQLPPPPQSTPHPNYQVNDPSHSYSPPFPYSYHPSSYYPFNPSISTPAINSAHRYYAVSGGSNFEPIPFSPNHQQQNMSSGYPAPSQPQLQQQPQKTLPPQNQTPRSAWESSPESIPNEFRPPGGKDNGSDEGSLDGIFG